MTKIVGHSISILGLMLAVLFMILWLTVGIPFVKFIGIVVTCLVIVGGAGFAAWYWFYKVKTL
jgi:hypothetical protein